MLVVTTCAATLLTLIVDASCCALSSLSSAANETVKLADGGVGLVVTDAGVLSARGGVTEGVVELVELAVNESPTLSEGKVTG